MNKPKGDKGRLLLDEVYALMAKHKVTAFCFGAQRKKWKTPVLVFDGDPAWTVGATGAIGHQAARRLNLLPWRERHEPPAK